MMDNSERKDLIAPCGMDCGLCSGYLAYINGLPKKRGAITHCAGCRPRNKQCAFVKRDCSLLKNNEITFCYECDNYPCERLKRLNKGYITRYGMGFIENLNSIRDDGIEKFLEDQKRKYACPKCGNEICVHNKKCYKCETITSWKG